MTGLSVRNGEWVVVCDGAKALVLENVGDAKFPNLKTIQVFEQKDLATHEMGADKPGRSYSSVGHGRSAVSQTDWHDQAEQELLATLARRLDQAAQGGDTRGIVLVASPRALGMIRPLLSGAVEKLVRGEVAKDYAGMPVDQIEKRLSG
jgi:protein required for attachment to host cells